MARNMLGREEDLQRISGLLKGSFPTMLVVGPPRSGKSSLLKVVLNQLNEEMATALVSCLSATIRIADIFEDVLRQVGIESTCANFSDFVQKISQMSQKKLVIVLKNADRLRGLDPLLLPGLMRLHELVSNVDVSVVLVSNFPWPKWRLNTHLAGSTPVHVFLKPYNRNQLGQILHENLQDFDEPQVLKDNFVELILSVFQPVCKSYPQFKRASNLLWPVYIKPTKEAPKVEPENARSLYRCVESEVKKVMANIHYQEATSMMTEDSKSKRLGVELPFLSKFLLLASYLASYNPASTDKRFFMRSRSGRIVKKSSKLRQQAHQRSSQLLGPKLFDLNRMLAIFHVIVDQKVSASFEIQSQVASLVTLQMLSQSGEDLDLPKYKCNVGLDFIRQVAKNVGFELHRYLYDVDY